MFRGNKMKEENMKPENTRTIHRVINVFGAQNQKMQALEELMELQSALFENVHRETDNRKNIVEEVADVEIMLAQIKEIFDIKPKEIEEIQDYKLRRLDHTIEKYLAKHQNDSSTSKQQIHIDRETSNGR